MIYMFTLRAS